MNFFSFFKRKPKEQTTIPTPKKRKTDKEIEYEEILKVYREEQDELNFSVIIEKLNNIFVTNCKNFPKTVDFSIIIEKLFENVLNHSFPPSFIEEFFIKNYKEFCALNVLIKMNTKHFTQLQVQKIVEIVVNTIKFVCEKNSQNESQWKLNDELFYQNKDIQEDNEMFQLYEHADRLFDIPSKVSPNEKTKDKSIIGQLLYLIRPFYSFYHDLLNDSLFQNQSSLSIPSHSPSLETNNSNQLNEQTENNETDKKEQQIQKKINVLLFLNEINLLNIEAFIDHYNNCLSLYKNEIDPTPIIEKIQSFCQQISESTKEEQEIQKDVNSVLCLINCITKLYPTLPIEYKGIIPYQLESTPSMECLTYYYNILQSTSHLEQMIQHIYSISLHIPSSYIEEYYFLLRKSHLFIHSMKTSTQFFQTQLKLIQEEENKQQYAFLLNGFARLLICLEQEERTEFFEFFKRNYKNEDIMTPLIDGLIEIRLSPFYLIEYILESGLSYYLRLIVIGTTTELKVKTLYYLIEMMKHPSILTYFKSTEPKNFFPKTLKSIASKEEFELCIEMMTSLLYTIQDDELQQLSPSISSATTQLLSPKNSEIIPPSTIVGYIKLIKYIEDIDKLEYRIQILKLWKIRIQDANEETIRDYMYFVKKCFEEKEGSKEYFTIVFDGLSLLKNNKFGISLYNEFIVEEHTFERIEEIYKILGNDIFIILRNISLKSMFNVIDEPITLNIMLKLMLKLPDEECDKLIGEIFLPLVHQIDNLDILSKGELPELLIPFIVKSKHSKLSEFLIKKMIRYHCNHKVLETIIKHIHTNKTIKEGMDQIIISSFEQYPSPTYFVDISQHTIKQLSFLLPFQNQKSFSICTWFSIHSFPEYTTQTAYLFSLSTQKHTIDIHCTPAGICLYFKESTHLFEFAIREKMFHNIICTINHLERMDSYVIHIYVDGTLIGTCEEKGNLMNQPMMKIQSTEQVRLRLGNIIIYKAILEETTMQRLIFCDNCDYLPTQERWYCPIDVRYPKESIFIPYSVVLNVRTRQIISAKEVHSLKIEYGKSIGDKMEIQTCGRCLHGKKMMELLGGFNVLLLLMAEMKDDRSVLLIFDILMKYLSKNGRVSHEFVENGGFNIVFSILNSRQELFNSSELVDSLLDFSTNRQQEIFTSSLLIDKFVFNVDIWKKANDEILIKYLERIDITMKSPHMKFTIEMLEECKVFERMLKLIDRAIENKMIKELFIDITSRLLQLPSWKSYLEQLMLIIQSHYEKQPITRGNIYNDKESEMTILNTIPIGNYMIEDSFDNSAQEKDKNGNPIKHKDYIVIIINIIYKRALAIKEQSELIEFLTLSTNVLPIGMILDLIANVSNKYIDDVLKYLFLLITHQQTFDRFVYVGGFVRLFNSLRSLKRLRKYSYSTIKLIASFTHKLGTYSIDKSNHSETSSDPSLLLLLCTVNEMPSTSLELFLKEFGDQSTTSEGRYFVSCKMYYEIVFHIVLSVIHRNEKVDVLNNLMKMYEAAMNESQKRSVEQVASKLNRHFVHITTLIMTEITDFSLIWKFYFFLYDINTKYVLTQNNMSFKTINIYILGIIWKSIVESDFPLTKDQQKYITEKFKVKELMVLMEKRLELFETKHNEEKIIMYYILLLNALSLSSMYKLEVENEQYQENETFERLKAFDIESLKELKQFVKEVCDMVDNQEYEHIYLLNVQPSIIDQGEVEFTRLPPEPINEKFTFSSRIACMYWRKIFKKYTSPENILSYNFPLSITPYKLLPIVSPSFIHTIIDYSTPKLRNLPTMETITPEVENNINEYLKMKEIVPYVPPVPITNGIQCKRIKREDEIEGVMEIKDDIVDKLLVFQYTVQRKNKDILKEIILPLNGAVITKKMYLYENNSLEIITKDGYVEFFIFKDKQTRKEITKLTGKSPSKLQEATKQWSKGVISNFEYLGIINNEASRSFRTLCQYPIYPWVLSKYENETFRLSDIQMYRNFERPIGAQTDIEHLEENYQEKECHYNSCMSSPSVVFRMLFRLRPYTDMLLKEMSGRYLEVDGRIFTNVGSLYTSSTIQSRIEVIPEFYSCEEMYLNINKLKGETSDVGNVDFPRWGNTSRLFVHQMREALEGQEVSQNIHSWIDLVFGVDQQSRLKYNIFGLEYTKESEMDDTIKQMIWKTMGNIPNKIFTKPHPKRIITPRLLFNVHNPHAELAYTLKPGISFLYENAKFNSYKERRSFLMIDKEFYHVRYQNENTTFVLYKGETIIDSINMKAVDIIDYLVYENGNKIVYGCESGEVCLIKHPFSKQHSFIQFHGIQDDVTAIGYCTDYHTVVIASKDKKLRLYNENGTLRKIIKTDYVVSKILFSNRSGDMITLCQEGNKTMIYGYTINGSQYAHTIVNAVITASNCTHFIDGSIKNILALGSESGELMIYDFAHLEFMGSCYGGHSSKSKTSSKVLAIKFVENYSRLFFFVESPNGVDVIEIK